MTFYGHFEKKKRTISITMPVGSIYIKVS
uniref:Uncharacterized protein n=1 Tax=Anguilla anguilla TaxID=7936 RepID=A0A0E9U5H5_ANGAN